MKMVKLTKEQREKLVAEVQQYHEEERGEPIGELAAEQFVTFMIQAVGPYVYNQALEDARAMLGERWMSLEDELYAMQQPTTSRDNRR